MQNNTAGELDYKCYFSMFSVVEFVFNIDILIPQGANCICLVTIF